MRTLHPDDVIVVLDVTATENHKNDFTIEKCKTKELRDWVQKALQSLEKTYNFEIFEGCPDPVAFQDETDAFREKTPNVFFLGAITSGGDYNDGPVKCNENVIWIFYVYFKST